ncbi:hypothetical protein F8M41_025448 [Gigaspora margarita]|uniref:Uncharacterized protein n=1 Tax=Gigaspora margarita TaxID=4874 RepID=A0A8H3XM97_GIGMA|nr:hypothetical protein F8M41_025448 [Gigaspora margarita]
MVFDQSQSRFGIASRSDIDYGPLPQARIVIELPWFLTLPYLATCLKITDQLGRSQVFSIDYDDNDNPLFLQLSDSYLSQESFTYSIDFYYNLLNNTGNCTDGLRLIYTPSLKANVTTGLWNINLFDYSTLLRLQIPIGVECFVILALFGQTIFYEILSIMVPKAVVKGEYIIVPLFVIYLGGKYTFVAFDNFDDNSGNCTGNVITSNSSLYPIITDDLWTIHFN